MKNLGVEFSPPNEYTLNSILEVIKGFGKVYYNNYKYSFIKIESSSHNKLGNNVIDIKGPKIEGPKIPGIDIKGPKIPGIDIKGPKIEGPKIDIKGPKIDIKGPKIKEPKIDIKGPKIEGPKIPGIDIKGPKINIYPQIPNISAPLININISNARKYKIIGEKDNILTKIGEDNNWMGAICINELENPQENIWKIKILKSQYKYILWLALLLLTLILILQFIIMVGIIFVIILPVIRGHLIIMSIKKQI